MTEPIPDKQKGTRGKRRATTLQADLPLVEPLADTAPEPATKPAPGASPEPPAPTAPPAQAAALAPPSLADRAARYNRHHSARDDRPLSEQLPARSQPPTPVAPPPRSFHPVREAPVAQRPASRPAQVDMAALAARNRQARDAAREDRPLGTTTPPPARPAQRTGQAPAEPAAAAPGVRARDVSMLARAARHNALARESAQETAGKASERKSPRAPATSAASDGIPAGAAAGPSMVARAADATRRRRDVLGGPVAAPLPEALATPPVHLPTTAFVLVSRNDGGRVLERFAAWRRLLEQPDLRWWLLDLGSVDESIARGEEAHAQVLAVPGGAVVPMQTLTQLLQRLDVDTVVLADVDVRPDASANQVLADVRAGRTVAFAGGVLALDRSAWMQRDFSGCLDLGAWLGRPLPGTATWLQYHGPFVPRLLHAPRLDEARAQVLPLVQRLRRLVTSYLP